MNSKWIASLAAAVLLAVIVVGAALAMNSDNFRLDWNELQSSASGAGSSSSTNYKISNSIGAPMFVRMETATTKLELGYWPGAYPHGRQMLPYVRK